MSENTKQSTAEPVEWQDIVSAIRAVGNEAARRGGMFPQTRDEQDEDTLAVRRVVEMIEWYATKGGAVATSLPGWPKHPAQPKESKEIQRLEKTLNDFGKVIHDMVVGQQAAWIEWKHGKGAEEGMVWIHNALFGPGFIPYKDDPYVKDAQAYYDTHRANPFPKCSCGRPSHIAWMGMGFCCKEHLDDAERAMQKEKGDEHG
jgi:hypothetical protein